MNEENNENNENNGVLLEKVREIEKAKRENEKIDAKSDDRHNTSKILNEKRILSAPMTEAEAKKMMASRSRRTFLIGGAAALAGILGWRSLSDETKSNLYNRAFRFNERASQTFFGKDDLAPEFPRELAGDRVNGMIGLDGEFDTESWKLQVVGLENPEKYPHFSPNITFEGEDNAPRSMDSPPAPIVSVAGLVLSLDDIKSLPRVEMTTELKCIEGWSMIFNWTGARFSDFAAKFAPPANTQYVSLVTPDRAYYVGWDMPSIMHPQTLLAYEMNGAPLTPAHGAPLRLVTTTKYGIKQLKRIGRIEFTNERPADYWAENGYDWYSGH